MGSDAEIVSMLMLDESTSSLSYLIGTTSITSDCIGHDHLRDVSSNDLSHFSSPLFLAIKYTKYLEFVFGSYNGLWLKWPYSNDIKLL
jgi:hypothetical protein